MWFLLDMEFSNTSLRHVLIMGREQRPAVPHGSWAALTYTFSCLKFFCYCYPNWILFKPVLHSNKVLRDLWYTKALSSVHGWSLKLSLFKDFSLVNKCWKIINKITLSVKWDIKWLRWWLVLLRTATCLQIHIYKKISVVWENSENKDTYV